MKRILASAALAASLASPAVAQMACFDRPALAGGLAAAGRIAAASGVTMASDGSLHLIEIYVNPDGREFSIIATTPDGTSCIILNGSEFGPASPAAAPSREG